MTCYETYSLIFEFLGFCISSVTLILAAWGISTWKKEHVGKKKLDLLGNMYPHLKTIEKNIPYIFRLTTTDYEKKQMMKKLSDQSQNYTVMDCIDFRLQHIFGKHFKALQEHSYFADMFLDEELKNIYYGMAELNFYFPIDYNEKTDQEISRYENRLKDHSAKLTAYIIDEIKKLS